MLVRVKGLRDALASFKGDGDELGREGAGSESITVTLLRHKSKGYNNGQQSEV